MRVLDLFCGAAGGWSLGLHRAGFETVAACEIDPWRRAVYGANNPRVRLYDDVRTLSAARLLDDLGFLPEVICGSPPCQDASLANTNGKGVDGERTGLFFEAVRLVREVRPCWVLLENVPGLRARGYDRVHDALEEAGYAVWPLVVGAVHAGAPHLRKRVWIIAASLSAQEQMGRAGFARGEALREDAADSRIADAIGRGTDRGGAGGRKKLAALLPTPIALQCHMTDYDALNSGTAGRKKLRKCGLYPEQGQSKSFRNGAVGTAGLLTLVEWMMGYPKRWLLDAALAAPCSPPTATRSSRR